MASRGAGSCTNPARCACGFRRPKRWGSRRCSSIPRAGGGGGPRFVSSLAAGGGAGGDRVDIDIGAGEGARLEVPTAAAEKIYRAQGPAAQLNLALKAA